MNLISFKIEPTKNHEMQYKVDERKDKCISGENKSESPVVQIDDKLCRAGVLKVVCVNHMANEDGEYSLHPNFLVDVRNSVKRCDKYGVASFKFGKKQSNVEIDLKLCIRRCRVNDVNEIRNKWNQNDDANKFDPFGIGYGDFDKFDLQRVRLCCQAIFEDNEKSNVIVSDVIFSGTSDIKIEYWDNSTEFSVHGGDKLCVFVRKLTTDQRNVYAKFSDYNNWESDEIEPIHRHHDYGFVFIVPAYKDYFVKKPVLCKFQLFVRNKDYCSEAKPLKYIKSSMKRELEDEIDDDDLCNYNKTEICYKKRARIHKSESNASFDSGYQSHDSEFNDYRIETCNNIIPSSYNETSRISEPQLLLLQNRSNLVRSVSSENTDALIGVTSNVFENQTAIRIHDSINRINKFDSNVIDYCCDFLSDEALDDIMKINFD